MLKNKINNKKITRPTPDKISDKNTINRESANVKRTDKHKNM